MGNLASRLNSIPPTPNESFAELFGTSADEKRIVQIRLCDLEFAEQHTPMYNDDELTAMAESIISHGVEEPILVRKMAPDTTRAYEYYQILNGRNRTAASRVAGCETIPAIILEVNDTEAQYIIATTTIHQRQELKPSAKAWAYRALHDAEKLMSGARTDLVHNVHKVDTLAKIAQEADTSKRTAAYYIRLTYLTRELVSMVDANKLPIRAGAALSYLSEGEQDIVHAYLTENRKSMSVEQAELIKEYSERMGAISHSTINNVMKPIKNVIPTAAVSFARKDMEAITKHIPCDIRTKSSEATAYIVTALRYYEEHAEVE